jgi:hypothetical protein
MLASTQIYTKVAFQNLPLRQTLNAGRETETKTDTSAKMKPDKEIKKSCRKLQDHLKNCKWNCSFQLQRETKTKK